MCEIRGRCNAGALWRALTVLLARHPSVAGEPLARLILDHPNRLALNGALYQLDKRKRDQAMHDAETGGRLWGLLEAMLDAELLRGSRPQS